MRKFLFKYLSFLLSGLYNLLVSSAQYQYIIKIQKKYPLILTKSFHIDTYIYGEGHISIGEGSYLGKGTFIYSDPKEAMISIGKNCMISHNVQIRTLTYESDSIHLDPSERKYKFDNIIIGDNVWIGANVFIKNGIRIGDNVIIGAGSVVTKSFEDDLIISGAPAKIIKSRLDNNRV